MAFSKKTAFIKDLEHRISQRSGDDRETQLFFQRLSVIVQRSNVVLFGESFWLPSTIRTCDQSTARFLTFVFNLRDLYYQGYFHFLLLSFCLSCTSCTIQ